jgi:hypothetical protein
MPLIKSKFLTMPMEIRGINGKRIPCPLLLVFLIALIACGDNYSIMLQMQSEGRALFSIDYVEANTTQEGEVNHTKSPNIQVVVDMRPTDGANWERFYEYTNGRHTQFHDLQL